MQPVKTESKQIALASYEDVEAMQLNTTGLADIFEHASDNWHTTKRQSEQWDSYIKQAGQEYCEALTLLAETVMLSDFSAEKKTEIFDACCKKLQDVRKRALQQLSRGISGDGTKVRRTVLHSIANNAHSGLLRLKTGHQL